MSIEQRLHIGWLYKCWLAGLLLPLVFVGVIESGGPSSYSFTTIDYPGSTRTTAYGISGNKIVGAYLGDDWHGFLYDGSTWTTIDYPGARQTSATDIDGNNIVGICTEGGFLYNHVTQTWTLISDASDQPYGIDGSNIVGHGGGISFLAIKSGATWTTFSYPDFATTSARAIDGANIVGGTRFLVPGGNQGFLYNYMTETWEIINYPGSESTIIYGIDGGTIIGDYRGRW